jgi:hypothetical protein
VRGAGLSGGAGRTKKSRAPADGPVRKIGG